MINLEELGIEDPIVAKKIAKYCRENGIDMSSGKIDENMLKSYLHSLSDEERDSISNCSKIE
jgi:hypothetical protein